MSLFTENCDCVLYCPSTVEYSGQIYNTVAIGDQCWLKENLNVGVMLDGSLDQSDNSTIEKYCNDNSDANCTTYGGLYQWNEAMQYSILEGSQGICPAGWHIPTLVDYNTLVTYVGGDGNALKEVGQGTGAGARARKNHSYLFLNRCRCRNKYEWFFLALGRRTRRPWSVQQSRYWRCLLEFYGGFRDNFSFPPFH